MSVGSWYVFFVKLIDQQKIIKEGRRARTVLLAIGEPARRRQQARQERRLSPDRRRRPASPRSSTTS
jgi:hypothetical protein